MTLVDYCYSAQPGIDEALISQAGYPRFLDEATNVIFIEPPRMGKIMLAIGLARGSPGGTQGVLKDRDRPSSLQVTASTLDIESAGSTNESGTSRTKLRH